ncbi:ABC transporter permease [Pantoea sp. NPDC088449]|uniref:Autoinducer 2 import system permease protein LsrC n=1 Tax=Candidatus Pantoea floridensis TaxID=1938870 RepID=A0A286DLH5_9GAMM|nr:ABC transporter permease [Pantoea floridensis]PIF14828.1 ribose transport system permease protein/rhamnose transport system permease protein [Enterobacteriaceae bacterium JKS000233]SOD59453.1 ribose transport system permease protein/rhamnose transport system permease protein [Pantoea floridensis]HBZ15436.1 ABC transporter permease [Pantoea sp.]
MTLWRKSPDLTLLIALWLLLAIGIVLLLPQMLASWSITSILQFATLLSLVALGQSLVVMTGGGGIDLSVGGNVSLSAVLGMLALDQGINPAWLPLICLLTGTLAGAINGWLIARLRLWPLIVTLGSFYLFSGLALALTGGAAIAGVPTALTQWGRGAQFFIPLPFLTCVIPAFLIAWLILSKSAWGKWIYACGFNEHATRLVGIPVDRLRLLAYCLSGLLAGCAGFVSLTWLGSARPEIGVNLELESLTAALLGGVAIFGGRGSVVGVLAAALMLVTIKTCMLQLGLNSVWQLGVVGMLLIIVLMAQRLFIYRR